MKSLTSGILLTFLLSSGQVLADNKDIGECVDELVHASTGYFAFPAVSTADAIFGCKNGVDPQCFDTVYRASKVGHAFPQIEIVDAFNACSNTVFEKN